MARQVGTFVLAVQVLLATVFATAGVGKLLDRSGSRTALQAFGVPRGAIGALVYLLPAAELATAVALIFHATARWGAVAALLLLLTFIYGIARALAQGVAPDCHCFGQIQSSPAGRGTLVRNGVLAALAAVVIVHGPGTSLNAWVDARSAAELAAVALGIVAVVLAGIGTRLWLDNRTLRRERDDERAVIAGFPPGLPVGAEAPEFALTGLDGETTSLAGLLEPGRPVALVFVSPTCGPCRDLLPDLARWQVTLSERLTIGVVSSGSADDNASVGELELGNIGLQDKIELMQAYRVTATPSAVMVAPTGRIASAVSAGADMIAPLIRVALRQPAETNGTSRPATNGASIQVQQVRRVGPA
jgi:uncharacterized membrane protein YphA (DoxX/SURF4 family)/thiol-disulfide isomerase/thioredoxin